MFLANMRYFLVSTRKYLKTPLRMKEFIFSFLSSLNKTWVCGYYRHTHTNSFEDSSFLITLLKHKAAFLYTRRSLSGRSILGYRFSTFNSARSLWSGPEKCNNEVQCKHGGCLLSVSSDPPTSLHNKVGKISLRNGGLPSVHTTPGNENENKNIYLESELSGNVTT